MFDSITLNTRIGLLGAGFALLYGGLMRAALLDDNLPMAVVGCACGFISLAMMCTAGTAFLMTRSHIPAAAADKQRRLQAAGLRGYGTIFLVNLVLVLICGGLGVYGPAHLGKQATAVLLMICTAGVVAIYVALENRLVRPPRDKDNTPR